VCVHNNIVYPVGTTWEDGCRECSCTRMRDDVTGLQMMECHDKACNTYCPRGYRYIVPDGECCGRCQKIACEEKLFWSPGDEDPPLHEDIPVSSRLFYKLMILYLKDIPVIPILYKASSRLFYKLIIMVGTEWRSPFNPCIINECVQVNNEVFVQKKNVSCSQMDVPDCPEGTELRCNQIIDCCPSCRCAVNLAQHNYRRQEVSGSCCGKCVPTSCSIRLRDGRLKYLQPNESLQDGCDNHSCRVTEKGEFVWERRITSCPPFDSRRCLAEGGRIAKIGSTCCDTCVQVECRTVSTRMQYGNINGCVAEKEVPISHCEGKCRSITRYSVQTGKWEDVCSCCTATQTTIVTIPLRCANGTVVQHYIPSASLCECHSRKCTD
ncbi:PREDICTED: von Willebrand factor-like, partial [Acanthisitta chloris]|uniref:von Willebrand factor-like n=1 Tax=Acanthisitta chloris TaxID=57068 RepID=UPI0004F0C758